MDTTPTRQVKRILILGANGQLGRLLHEYLSVQFPETEVIGCVRNTQNISCKALVFNPFADCWQKLEKADVLINCIGIIQEMAETTFEKTHEGITRLILKNRHFLGNPRIIQISALGADENSSISFLRTKGKADQLLLSHADTIVVRPSIVCTSNTMLIQKLRLLHHSSRYFFSYLPFPSNLLTTSIQPIMPGDMAAIVTRLCCLENPPAIVHAVGPSPLSLQQLIELSLGKGVRLIKLSKKVSDSTAYLTSLLFPKLLSQEQYRLLQRDNIYAVEEAEHILGRKLQSTESFWKI